MDCLKGASPRRRARCAVLQVLHEVDASAHSVDSSLAWVLEQVGLNDANRRFAGNLVHQVAMQTTELDETIKKHAPAWPVEQLPRIDRNILRMAVCEMKAATDTSIRVIINEAVELAKIFGSDNSPRFVNGVLGAIAKASQPN